MKNPLVSVVIPVYNTEVYLEDCIRSVLNQSYANIEVILVDDCSSDNCYTICEEFKRLDNRISVFHNNQRKGVSKSRNLGIKQASGEWITFIDADDLITENFIASLVNPIHKDDSIDFVHAGCLNFENNHVTSVNQQYDLYESSDPLFLFRNFRGLAVSKMFKKVIIDRFSVFFDERMTIAEDMVFTLDYIIHVNQYVFIPETGYYYRRDNSISATKTIKQPYSESLYGFNRLYKSTLLFMDVKHLDAEDCIYRLSQRANNMISTLACLYKEEDKRVDRLKHIREDFSEEQYSLHRYNQGDVIYRLLGFLLRYHLFVIFDLLLSSGVRLFRK